MWELKCQLNVKRLKDASSHESSPRFGANLSRLISSYEIPKRWISSSCVTDLTKIMFKFLPMAYLTSWAATNKHHLEVNEWPLLGSDSSLRPVFVAGGFPHDENQRLGHDASRWGQTSCRRSTFRYHEFFSCSSSKHLLHNCPCWYVNKVIYQGFKAKGQSL